MTESMPDAIGTASQVPFTETSKMSTEGPVVDASEKDYLQYAKFSFCSPAG